MPVGSHAGPPARDTGPEALGSFDRADTLRVGPEPMEPGNSRELNRAEPGGSGQNRRAQAGPMPTWDVSSLGQSQSFQAGEPTTQCRPGMFQVWVRARVSRPGNPRPSAGLGCFKFRLGPLSRGTRGSPTAPAEQGVSHSQSYQAGEPQASVLD